MSVRTASASSPPTVSSTGRTLRLVFRHVGGDHTHIDVTGDVVRVEESGETFRVAVRVDEIHVN